MTLLKLSSNGSIFRITGPLCREFTGHRWIPLAKASDAELCLNNTQWSKQSRGWWFAMSSHSLWRHCSELVAGCNGIYGAQNSREGSDVFSSVQITFFTWWCHQMKTFSALLALCVGNWPVNSPQWRGALMFPLICAWINTWVNNSEAGDLRCHCAHYDVIVIKIFVMCQGIAPAITLMR